MHENIIKSITIIGGGSAGWMAARMLVSNLPNCEINLIESKEISIIGVGEATIPPIKIFNQQARINEKDFLKNTKATFKLGIEFVGWGNKNSRYIHPFGQYAADFSMVPLYHYWLSLKNDEKIDEYSLACMAAKSNKFMHPINNRQMIQSTFDYAYHFDAQLYADYLRELCKKDGVNHIYGNIKDAELNPDSGCVEKVIIDDGKEIKSDFFIDCTGFRGVLIEQKLKTGYVDWSEYLPCNRAIAMPTSHNSDPAPYTISTAHKAGWQWKIPLQHRVGNGHVYCSEYISDDEALDILKNNITGEILAEPKFIKFTTGHRKKFWHKNVLAVGLSSGFMEPLESTSIHLIQSAISRFLALFPDLQNMELNAKEYNKITLNEYENIRDFLILHYWQNQREEEFWKNCRKIKLSDNLLNKIEHFKNNGRLIANQGELFANPSWVAVYIGQNLIPKRYDPIIDYHDTDEYKKILKHIKDTINKTVETFPLHHEYLQKILAS